MCLYGGLGELCMCLYGGVGELCMCLYGGVWELHWCLYVNSYIYIVIYSYMFIVNNNNGYF